MVVVPPGASTVDLSIEVLPDNLVEGEESFEVVLTSVTLGELADSVGRGTIKDDDGVRAEAGGPYSGEEGALVPRRRFCVVRTQPARSRAGSGISTATVRSRPAELRSRRSFPTTELILSPCA